MRLSLMLLFVSLSLLLTAFPAYADHEHRGSGDSVEDLGRQTDRQQRRMADNLADMERLASQLPPCDARDELFATIDRSRRVLKRMARTDGALLDLAVTPVRGGYERAHRRDRSPVAVSGETLQNIKRAVERRPFDDDRLELLKDATGPRLFTAHQVKDLVQMFTFSDGRLDAATWLHARTLDPENFYVVYDALTFSSDRDALRRRIRARR